MSSEGAPESFMCPITLTTMVDPVCDKEGNTFEKTAIEEWLTLHGCSPITRTPMTIADLIPNRALKDMIFEYYKNPGQQPKQPAVKISDNSDQHILADDEIKINAIVQNSKVLISVDPGNSAHRSAVNVACVIDISGSMGTEAQVPGDKQGVESQGLNVLDLVKHAVTTIIKSLTVNDTLALITFSDSAEVVFPLTKMDASGQHSAILTLKSLQPTNSTNIWGGLEKGLDVLNSNLNLSNNSISTVFLFTDGEPNVIPPRGHIPMLQMYKDSHGGNLPGIINTFGFGYGLDSELLYELAWEGQGMYSFIPDSGFVGTVFVHAIANLLTTMATNCRLTIEPLNGTTFLNAAESLGPFLVAQESWGLVVDLCSLQTGQCKNIVLELGNVPAEGAEFLGISLGAKTRTNPDFKMQVQCKRTDSKSNSNLIATTYRFKFIQLIQNVLNMLKAPATGKLQEAQGMVNSLIQEMGAKPQDNNGEFTALLEDIKGQVLESVHPDYYTKWGRHYLPSLMMAHLYQVCNNFKDPGPQVYGGALFKKMRDEADALFMTLPPPKPSIQKSSRQGHQNRPVNMRAYNNSRGVCFHGKNSVQMADGSKKSVESIVKGDKVETKDGKGAKVICVVQTIVEGNVVDMVTCPESGLVLTPWHPIRNEHNDWVFPATLAEAVPMSCEFLYNFVLDSAHVMLINGVECITIGHSFNGPICAHSYFGSDQVLKDLKKMNGWDEGLVRITGVTRDAETSEVNGMIEHNKIAEP